MKTHSIVKSGETTVPYCAAFALLGSVPFVLGDMVSVQMPHQHRILGNAAHTIRQVFTRLQAYIQMENALAKVRRMARPFPQPTLIFYCIFHKYQRDYQKWVSACGKTKWGNGPAHSKRLVFRRIIQLVMQLDEAHGLSFTTAFARKENM